MGVKLPELIQRRELIQLSSWRCNSIFLVRERKARYRGRSAESQHQGSAPTAANLEKLHRFNERHSTEDCREQTKID